MKNNSFIHIENLVFKYDTLWGLRGVNLQIPKGKLTAILGPNGAGKSTLIKLIANNLDEYSGTIKIDGENIKTYSTKKLAKKIGYVPQEMDVNYPFIVDDIIKMGRFPYHEFWQSLNAEDEELINSSYEYTETTEFKNREFNKLSGGEKKRVLIASALAQIPEILLLDEPTNGIDFNHQIKIFNILKETQIKHNRTIVLVTHDINFASQFCDNLIFMVNGEIISSGGVEQLWDKKMIEKIYSVKFHIMKHPFKNIPMLIVNE